MSGTPITQEAAMDQRSIHEDPLSCSMETIGKTCIGDPIIKLVEAFFENLYFWKWRVPRRKKKKKSPTNADIDVIPHFEEDPERWSMQELKGRHRLHLAAESNSVEMIEMLLKQKTVDINIPGDQGITALHLAANYGHVAVVECLVNAGASVSAKTKHGWQALHHAVVNEHAAVSRILLEKGADASVPASDGWTQLHLATDKGNTTLCNLLLDHKADFDATTDEDWTPLHFASKTGLVGVCDRLVMLGSDIKRRNAQGMTALDLAVWNNATECCISLLKRTLPTEDLLIEVLHKAVLSGSVETVERLIQQGANVNGKGAGGNRAIHVAAWLDTNAPVIVLLHQGGCDITALNDEGETAKQIAHDLHNWKLRDFLTSLESQLEVIYPIQRKGSGEVLIINNQDYTSAKYPTRVGSDKDVDSLRETFDLLEYSVEVHTNLEFTDMATVVWEFSKKPSMKEASVVFIVLLAHGSGNILGVDGERSLNAYDIVELVAKQECLVGKPKIVITQACKGSQENDGMEPFIRPSLRAIGGRKPRSRGHGDGCVEKRYHVLSDVVMRKAPQTELLSRVSYVRPIFGDFIIADSTVPGYQSYRDGSGKGSIFIQAFCKVMKEHAHMICFQDLLTKVNRLVVERFEVPNGTKMQPMFSSALNSKLFLNPRHRKDYYYGIRVRNV